MQNIKKIIADISLTDDIRMLTQSYEEISVMRMQKIRSSVLNTRQFLGKIDEIFQDVKNSYYNQIVALMKKNKNYIKGVISTMKKNGKTVSVLISANNRLHGDITVRVFRQFVNDISKQVSDIIIIGKLGQDLYRSEGLNKKYQYFEIPDRAELATELFTPIIHQLVNYEKVEVYYGKFESIVNQNPSVGNVSGNEELGLKDNKKQAVKFLFEPSLKKILAFFETQIFTSMFKQAVHESHLSMFASRINAMESALQNIEGQLRFLDSEKRRTKKLMDNKKQLERISGRLLWPA